jgi:dUTP pyrophosphatase
MNCKRLHPQAILPVYATEGAAGMDLHACLPDGPMTLRKGQIVIVPTGIAVDLTGYEGQIRSRSGLAAKHGVLVVNAPGTIDSDYRGEIKIILGKISEREDDEVFTINHGDRIAQMVVADYFKAHIREVKELDETVRGTGGFGSTGVSAGIPWSCVVCGERCLKSEGPVGYCDKHKPKDMRSYGP